MTTVREFASVSTLLVLFVFVFTFDVVCAIALVEKKTARSIAVKKVTFIVPPEAEVIPLLKLFRNTQ